MTHRFLTPLLTLICAVTGFTEITLPSVFSDHMVLQCGQTVPVWGTADIGATITVQFAGQHQSSTADANGRWRVNLPLLTACTTPCTLTISATLHSTTVTRQFSDVLVGEVWLCSGQSNMERPMELTTDAESAISRANHPLIRLYKTPKVPADAPSDKIDSCWTTCTPETVRSFSAVSYYFGKKLQQELHVPIGLLQSAWNGTRIEPWIPPCGFEGIDSLADIRAKIHPMPELGADPYNDRQFPTALYNGMLAAHIPYAIRGVIWYQGESNRRDGMLYHDKTEALLNGWRQLWGYDFPYYFVQIAPYEYSLNGPTVPEFWEAQAAIVKTIPNTGMAVVSDTATLDDIHPPNKEVPGTRLALLALDNTYDKEIVSTGPVFKSMKKPFFKNELVISFDSAEGLSTRDGKTPDWFEIAGKDGRFKPAQAVIKAKRVILSSPEVSNPVAMRFAWHMLAMPNLINAAGLPAPAFRAGKIPKPKPSNLTPIP